MRIIFIYNFLLIRLGNKKMYTCSVFNTFSLTSSNKTLRTHLIKYNMIIVSGVN